MDYELLKEMKDAGFQFKWRDDDPNDTAQGIKCFDPTLEELIDSITTPRFALYKVPRGWQAQVTDIELVAKGTDATEAVARLWLVLNKKV